LPLQGFDGSGDFNDHSLTTHNGLFSLNPDRRINPNGNIYYGYEGTFRFQLSQ